MAFERPVTPNFAAVYAGEPGYAARPAMDPMLKMSPRLRRTIPGANAWVTRKRLRRFAESIRSKSATVVDRNGDPKYFPALLTSTSAGPNRFLTAPSRPAT